MGYNEPMIVTDSAATKIHQLIRDEDDANMSLRVYINGGGCSGFQYNFMFDDAVNPDDTHITKTVKDDAGAHEVTVLVDPMSLHYLVNAEIDYREDAHGAQFIIRNPNAKSTCGCGSSFSID